MSELLGDRLRLKKIWTDFTTIDPSNIKVEERTSDINKKNIDPKLERFLGKKQNYLCITYNGLHVGLRL